MGVGNKLNMWILAYDSGVYMDLTQILGGVNV